MPITVQDLIKHAMLGGSGSGGSSGSGGEEGEKSPLDTLIDGSITELRSNNVQAVRAYAIYGTEVSKVVLTEAQDIMAYAFAASNDSKLVSVNLPKAVSAGNYAFYKQHSLTEINVPLLEAIGEYAFASNTNPMGYTKLDLPSAKTIGKYAFANSVNMIALILRGGTVATLRSGASLTSSSIYSGTGYVYVPRVLVDTYKAATNWATYASQIRALEDYTVDGTITGELDESKI